MRKSTLRKILYSLLWTGLVLLAIGICTHNTLIHSILLWSVGVIDILVIIGYIMYPNTK